MIKAVKAISKKANKANIANAESCDNRKDHTSSSVPSLKKDSLYLNLIRCQNDFLFVRLCFCAMCIRQFHKSNRPSGTETASVLFS